MDVEITGDFVRHSSTLASRLAALGVSHGLVSFKQARLQRRNFISRSCPAIFLQINPALLIERDTLGFQPHPLFGRPVAGPRRDFPLRVDYTLPGHIIRAVCHGITHDARIGALPDQEGNITVGGHLATRHLSHNFVDARK